MRLDHPTTMTTGSWARVWLLALVAIAAGALLALGLGRPAHADGATFILSSTAYSGTEGTNIVITVYRDGGVGQAIAYLDFTPGSAVSGVDYQEPGSVGLVFDQPTTQVGCTPPSGYEGCRTYELQTIDNASADGTRTLTVNLTASVDDSTGSPDSATISIQDDDGGAVFAFATSTSQVSEGNTTTT